MCKAFLKREYPFFLVSSAKAVISLSLKSNWILMFDTNLKDRFLFPLLPAWNDVGDDERFCTQAVAWTDPPLGELECPVPPVGACSPQRPVCPIPSNRLWPAPSEAPLTCGTLYGIQGRKQPGKWHAAHHQPTPPRSCTSNVCCSICRHHPSGTWCI